tara:strand:- start:31565 stop:33883 length:2319 start_codon:yes stop_codon:yes gene_type:complete
MSKNYNKNVFNSIIAGLLIILYLSIGFIPNLSAVDKIAPQWIFMTILNGVGLVFLAYNHGFYSRSIKLTLRSYMSLTYIGFIFWASLSYFYAINPTEVIVNITRQANVLLMYMLIGIFLFSIKEKIQFICWAIVVILSIEVYAVIIEAKSMIDLTGFISSGSLKGVTANRNITAFSIAIKIPFILFLFHQIKKRVFIGALIILTFLVLVCLSMIQSRASFLGVGLILTGYTFLNTLFYLKEKKIIYLIRISYFIFPLIMSISLNQIYFSSKGADAVSRAATISFSTNDGSVNQRLRYYKDVLTHLKSNPIMGVGLGNWKLKSIQYDADDIEGYVVPYHAHSDFIQLGAELGIIGFLLYLSIFFLALYYSFKLIRYSNLSNTEKTFIFLLLVALGVYFVDANLNFPIARPQVLVVWATIMSLLMGYYEKNRIYFKNEYKKTAANKLFIAIGILIVLPSLYVTNQVYKSLKGQMFLLQDFNTNSYNLALNKVDNIVPDIPNITVTTIPINSVKARYYFNAKKYKKALSLIEKGTKANPYLYYSEILKSQIFEEQGRIDSAKVYAKKAFFGLPNNDLHSSRYLNLLNLTKDKKAVDEAFTLLTRKNKKINWKNYLIIASGLSKENDKKLIERAKKATEIFPSDNDIKNLYIQISVGYEAFQRSIAYSREGLEYFDKGDHFAASLKFEEAIKNNPLDYSHYENAATSNYMTGNLQKALDQINWVINNLNPLNGKCEYIKALIFIKMNDPIGACPLLEISRDSGFSQAEALLKQYCG